MSHSLYARKNFRSNFQILGYLSSKILEQKNPDFISAIFSTLLRISILTTQQDILSRKTACTGTLNGKYYAP